jgi:uncharacterized RDD family membrane protein YckC
MTQIPAGWYPDPDPSTPEPRGQRYWDGGRWTEHVAPPAVSPYAPMTPYGGGQPGVTQKTTPDGQPLAGWWIRVGAYVMDWVVLTLATVAVGWTFVTRLWSAYLDFFDEAIRAGQNGAATPSQVDLMSDVAGPLLGFAAVSLVLNFLYNVGFLMWRQATPGKLVVGLRVRLRERPGPMSWGTVLLRWVTQNWYAALAFVPVLGSVASLYPLIDDLWPLWDDKNQALHDKAAGTNVVRHRR